MALLPSAIASMKGSADHYLQDLEVMTDQDVMESFGGAARKPVDFSYELGLINLRIAARIRGDEPPPFPDGDGWAVAPEELRSKAAITEYMKSSFDTLLDASSKLSEEDTEKLVGNPGHEQPILALIHFASLHTMYHDAQLNFIQTLKGDLEMHWQ